MTIWKGGGWGWSEGRHGERKTGNYLEGRGRDRQMRQTPSAGLPHLEGGGGMIAVGRERNNSSFLRILPSYQCA